MRPAEAKAAIATVNEPLGKRAGRGVLKYDSAINVWAVRLKELKIIFLSY